MYGALSVGSPGTPDWPGERDPSHRDVEIANETPDSTFLNTYTRNLAMRMATDQPVEQLMHMQLDNRYSSTEFTYPMSILYTFPVIPADDIVRALEESCAARFANDVILQTLPVMHMEKQQPVPPYVGLSLACLACASGVEPPFASSRLETVRNLFFAGSSLWNVMLEVDNTEARTLASVASPMVLSLCAVLTSDADMWSPVELQLLGAASTISRRIRLHESCTSKDTSASDYAARSSVLSLLLLVNVLSAIHMDLPLCITSNELFIENADASMSIHDIYSGFLERRSLALSKELSDHDLTTLLLMILADAISVERSLSKLSELGLGHIQTGSSVIKDGWQNHHVPLSPSSERQRMLDRLSNALIKWREASQNRDLCVDLYHFCRLYISYPAIINLPRAANYTPFSHGPVNSDLSQVPPVSEESVDLAWSILDSVRCDDSRGGLCATWAPIVVFLAGLTIWASTFGSAGHGNVMQLIAFKTKLERMSWPCAVEMAATLGRLIKQRR